MDRDHTVTNLQPEVYHALLEVKEQRNEIKEVIKEVRDFRLDAHGRITKLETKAGLLGFFGGLVGGGIISLVVRFIVEMVAR